MKSKLNQVVKVTPGLLVGISKNKVLTSRKKVLLQTYLNGLEIHIDNQ